MRRSLSQRPCERPARAGFTLIELLVVVAIISVLAALLLPALSAARKKVADTTCVVNQKQMALAATMWADDHDGTMPTVGALDSTRWNGFAGYNTPLGWQGSWWFFHENYVSDYRMLICPRQNIPVRAAGNSGSPIGLFNHEWSRNYTDLGEAFRMAVKDSAGAWYDLPNGSRFRGFIGTNFRSRRPHWYGTKFADDYRSNQPQMAYYGIKVPSLAISGGDLALDLNVNTFSVAYREWVDTNWPFKLDGDVLSHRAPNDLILVTCHTGNNSSGDGRDGYQGWHSANGENFLGYQWSIYPTATFDGSAGMKRFLTSKAQNSDYQFLPVWDTYYRDWND